MNAQQLYGEIKDAADYFRLKFSELNLMDVTLDRNKLRFSYDGKDVLLELPNATGYEE